MPSSVGEFCFAFGLHHVQSSNIHTYEASPVFLPLSIAELRLLAGRAVGQADASTCTNERVVGTWYALQVEEPLEPCCTRAGQSL